MRLLNKNGDWNVNENNNNNGLQMSQKQEFMEIQDDRAEDALKIEQELREITQMMSHLGELVHQQGQTIIGIDENIEDANDQMNGAIDQLQKYLATLSGNRWLMIKVFAILIFFAILFILIA